MTVDDPATQVEIQYRIEDDTLYLTQRQPVNSSNIRTRKLVRLE